MNKHLIDRANRNQLVDNLFEAYVDWREACARVSETYHAWTSSTPRGKVAFALYMAALDAEQQAAEVYAGRVRRAGRLTWSQAPAAEALGGPGWGG